MSKCSIFLLRNLDINTVSRAGELENCIYIEKHVKHVIYFSEHESHGLHG